MKHPDRENQFAPGKLWSLWEMLEFYAHNFAHIMMLLTTTRSGLRTLIDTGHMEKAAPGGVPQPKLGELTIIDLKALEAHLSEIGLTMSSVSVRSLLSYLQSGRVVPIHLTEKIHEVENRVIDELKGRLFLSVSAEEGRLIFSDDPIWGGTIQRAFPSTTEDIDEASKCLGYGRSTACVFHLMRALEVAATAVAAKIDATITDQHGKGLPWGVIADNMKPIIDKMPKGSEEQIRWYRAQQSLEAVNRAWRVPTAHPKHTYTLEEARRVFAATRAFMDELAPLV